MPRARRLLISFVVVAPVIAGLVGPMAVGMRSTDDLRSTTDRTRLAGVASFPGDQTTGHRWADEVRTRL